MRPLVALLACLVAVSGCADGTPTPRGAPADAAFRPPDGTVIGPATFPPRDARVEPGEDLSGARDASMPSDAVGADDLGPGPATDASPPPTSTDATPPPPTSTDAAPPPMSTDAAPPTAPPTDAPTAPPTAAPLCVPGMTRCLGAFQFEACNADGSGFGAPTPCPVDETCQNAAQACRPQACSPAETRCDDAFSLSACLPDGSAFGPSMPCPNSELCEVDRCVPAGCSPGVMFVVDRSTSMGRHWDTVQRSIDRVVADNPEVRFGFSGFPSRVGFFDACTVGESWPHVPIQRAGGPAIRDWFAANDVAGATPLLNAMQWLADHVDALWGPQPAEGVRGWLVVLSDGQDTCDCDNFEEDPDVVEACNREVSADMAGRARRLREQGIRTYVIGYTFGEDPLQIDSIAREGGTGLMEHIAAGNEATLDNAFAQIVDDVKDCPR